MKYLIANWKMHKSSQEVKDFFATSREALQQASGVEIVICPPFPLIPEVRNEVIGTNIKVGAQNLSAEEEGAYTGEVSGRQLDGLVDYVIVGHSERKRYFGETTKDIAGKLVQAFRHNLRPILCFEKIADLDAVNETGGLILAYEPPGSIGNGLPDSPEDAAKVARQAKDRLGVAVPVLYGGSAEARIEASFLVHPELSGLLVGTAALDPTSFVAMAQLARNTK